VDVVDIHTLIPLVEGTSYYEVGKLAFDLLPILLSRIEGSTVSWQLHQFLLCLQPFYLIENDPLGLEKVKVMQAIEEFLKV
jgi:hypothetical protein